MLDSSPTATSKVSPLQPLITKACKANPMGAEAALQVCTDLQNKHQPCSKHALRDASTLV